MLPVSSTCCRSALAKRPPFTCHVPRRGLFSLRRRPAPASPADSLTAHRLARRPRRYNQHRLGFLAAGAAAGAVGTTLISIDLYKATRASNGDGQTVRSEGQVQQKRVGIRLDAPDGLGLGEDGVKRKVVVHDELGREVVPTGNATVETFPRTIELSPPPQRNPTATDTITTAPQDPSTEYTLVGLGLRTVTMFGLQVYVLGFYVATADIARLQSHLIKRINPIATTLIPSEKDSLRTLLLDPAVGEEVWDTLIRDAGCRTLFRVVPVRDTSLAHMRDALVNAATGRGSRLGITDEAYGAAVRQFKMIFGKGGAGKGEELLLCRDGKGQLVVLYGDGRGKKRKELGRVGDERLSRMLWLNYLAGKKVASEQARANIIEGIMEFVERPVGTVAAQVI